MNIRTLKANEIDVRVAQINKNGASLLLYKDARVDMNILDEVYGADCWQREHQLIGDRLYCTIKVWNRELKQWISKQDVGVESYTEKEKGQASDSFKRAGFNVGIGRELYTAPRIWIGADKINIQTGNNGKLLTYDKFTVTEIDYNDNREIDKLVIVNQNDVEIFRYEVEKPITTGTINQINILAECYAQLIEGKTKDDVMAVIYDKFKIDKFENLTNAQGQTIVKTVNEWIIKQKKKNAEQTA